MTISTTSSNITYQANGSTTAWTFPFPAVDTKFIQVFLTSISGIITQLPSNAFTIVMNPPIDPNPTSIGGVVNYPLTGPPLPVGNQINIVRVLPVVQDTSIANQSIIYPPVVEQALDYLTLLDQDSAVTLDRAFKVPPGDPLPDDVPPVGLRANQLAFFDAAGNLTAGQLPPSGVIISAAMQPVVAASTLVLARQAMGLGSMATFSAGLGLQDNGAGAIQVNGGLFYKTTDQTVALSMHMQVHITTGTRIYNLPAANSVFSGWMLGINVLSGNVTLIPRPTDTIFGLPTGVNWVLPAGSFTYIISDGVSSWFLSYTRAPLPTYSILISGGTYFPPLGCTRVHVKMIGGGGGGGSGSGDGLAGGNGGVTIFSGWTANGGQFGNGSLPGQGGGLGQGGHSGIDGTGQRVIRCPGADGGIGMSDDPTINPATLLSGYGGGGLFGGGSSGTYGSIAGRSAQAYGSGGAGAPNGGTANGTGGGGGAGEFVDFIMTAVNVPGGYNYTAGVAGPQANSGAGNGAQGIIWIEELYTHGPAGGP